MFITEFKTLFIFPNIDKALVFVLKSSNFAKNN